VRPNQALPEGGEAMPLADPFCRRHSFGRDKLTE
jgi:hypothetical protein